MILKETEYMLGSYRAGQIMREIRRSKKIDYKFKAPQKYSQRPCQCLICGCLLTNLLVAHALKHGYKTREAMIEDGKIKWL